MLNGEAVETTRKMEVWLLLASFARFAQKFTLRTLQTPFVKNKNDDKERNAHPERSGRERNLKRRAR